MGDIVRKQADHGSCGLGLVNDYPNNLAARV
jgi:hypothetical protein